MKRHQILISEIWQKNDMQTNIDLFVYKKKTKNVFYILCISFRMRFYFFYVFYISTKPNMHIFRCFVYIVVYANLDHVEKYK